MRLLRGYAVAAVAACAGLPWLAACSLATSFSGLAGSSDDAGVSRADGAPGTGVDGSMPQRDGATEPDGSMSSTGWGTVTVVQSKLSTGKPGVDLDQPTTPGTLLVVMCPDPKPPTPQGLAPNWQMLKSSYGAAIAIWPDHPGGIRHFTINDTNNNLFFVEMSGVPADVQLSGLVDTGPKAGGTTMDETFQ